MDSGVARGGWPPTVTIRGGWISKTKKIRGDGGSVAKDLAVFEQSIEEKED